MDDSQRIQKLEARMDVTDLKIKHVEDDHNTLRQGFEKNSRLLQEIHSASVGRQKYEQGIKHGVSLLWAFIATSAAVAYSWFTKGPSG